MKKENWKTVEGFEPYQVSNLGNVRGKFGKILRSSFVTGGLAVVFICDGKRTSKRVARLVGEAFCKDYATDRYPTYKDGNPHNCIDSNLKWVPRQVVAKAPYSVHPKPLKK